MSVLVTGCSGMLGRALIEVLSLRGKALGVCKSGGYGGLSCDLTDLQQVKKLFELDPFDLVIHTAAYSDVDGCERNPKLAHESNALTTKYLAQSCGQKNIPFIYVSTDYVFDGAKKALYQEDDATCPINIYGMTKLEGEYHARQCAPVSAIVRTSWLFGLGNPNSFVNVIAERLKKEKVIRVLADQVDCPTSVRDLSLAIQKIGDYLVTTSVSGTHQRIFHVCNTGETTRYAMALKIKEVLGIKGVVVEKLDHIPVENRPALRPLYASMSAKRYETFFKTKLRRWEDSLKEYLTESA